ncbi:MAG: 3-deoxy-manno-octulosonate cytidylyltransferase [Chloracidobacterium sp.]|nr:3-deoxy-manno-octulosonate cytidylyltransferase [Chloracidobacterium sp.]
MDPQKNVYAVIPARLASTRLSGKMLRDVVGKPLIIRTLERALQAKSVTRTIVATDSREIFDVIEAAGGTAVMTDERHRSGSDRIAEVAESLPANAVVVNIQGDEPLISPETIDRAVAAMLGDDRPDIVTAFEPISSEAEFVDPNVVKLVMDQSGRALYFSRSPIPFRRNRGSSIAGLYKHCGLYVYRREYLLEFTKMPPTRLEEAEMLEQLRALETGAFIKAVEAAGTSISVDTEQDLQRVCEILG